MPFLSNTTDILELQFAQEQYQKMCIKSIFLDIMNFVEKYQFEDFIFNVHEFNFEVKEKEKWFSSDDFFMESNRDDSTLSNIDQDFRQLLKKYTGYWNDMFSFQEKHAIRSSWYYFNSHQYLDCAQAFGGATFMAEIEKEMIEIQMNHKSYDETKKLKIKV